MSVHHSISSGLKKIAIGLALTSFVLVTALPFDASRVQAAETKSKVAHSHHSAKKSPAKKSTGKKTSGKKVTYSYNPRFASIVIDADTGTVLSQNNADASVYPASLTKMMTLLLTFEGLENGTVNLNQRVQISNHAAAQAPSKLDLPAGSSIAMRDAIYAVVTKSANDIAVAIAENVGGTEARFVYLMNEKAKQLGMTHTRFVNPSGLHNTQQVTSARDFARLSRYLAKSYPHEYKYFSTKSFTYNGVANRNHNRLMETYRGMDGIKTGYIIPSGFNLAASAVRNNHRLIAVVFGGKTAQGRNNEVAALLDQGFAKIDNMGNDQQPLVSQNTIPLPDDRLSTTNGVANAAAPASMQTASLTRAPGQTVPAPIVPPTTAPVVPAKPILTTAKLVAKPLQDSHAVQVPQTGTMGEMAGQGDSDPAVTRRFETGMMAIAAIKGTLKPGQTSAVPADLASQAKLAALTAAAAPTTDPAMPVANDSNEWAIQLGSYTSRVKGEDALNAAITKLPADMKTAAKPVIVPLKAGDGWAYRARLQGFSREQASAACKYFNNCVAISPRAF